MTNPIIPVTTAAITDPSGKLTIAGRDFLRQLVAKLQTQIDGLSSADANIVRLLASLTDSDGNLLDLSELNVDELAAIAAVQTPGLMVRDALGQWYGRTLTGTSNRLSVTYGDGTQNNPLFDISAAYVGQTSITTLGTITTGTWHGTAVGAPYGGTGQTAYTVGDILYASTTSALSKLAATTNGYVLTLAAGVPAWVASSALSNPMTTAGDLIVGGASGTPTRVAAGTLNYVWTSNGPGVAPSWQAASGGGISALTGDVTASGTGSVAATLATAQPAVHTWALAQTFTVAPVFTDASGTRTALGLGSIATTTATGGVGITFGSPTADAALLVGAYVDIPVPKGYSLTGAWQLMAYPSGSITLDVRKSVFPSIPTTSIITSGGPAVSSSTSASGTIVYAAATLAIGDMLRLYVSANSGVKWVSLLLNGTRT